LQGFGGKNTEIANSVARVRFGGQEKVSVGQLNNISKLISKLSTAKILRFTATKNFPNFPNDFPI
jgi:hypothetical protein